MRNSKILDNTLDDSIYTHFKMTKKNIFLSIFGLFLLGFMLNFSLSEVVEQKIIGAISKNRSCPTYFEKLSFHIIPPKISIASPAVSGKCFRSQTDLRLNDLSLYFLRPTIFPPGILLNTEIKSDKTFLNVYPRVGLSGYSVRIDESNLNAKFLAPFMTKPDLVKGNIKIDTYMDFTLKNKIKEGKIHLKSKDLVVPPQNISGLNIPRIAFNDFSLKGSISPNKNILMVNSFILGDSKSPIKAKFRGDINLNQRNFARSEMNLVGEISFSPSFIDSFPILNLLLNGKKSENGFYQVRLTGTLMRPNKPEFL